MTAPDRMLRTLDEAERAIEGLQSYASPAELTEALRATWHAVDHTLRLLLRSDTTAPDAIRMSALSPETASDDVVTELRRRDLISLALAARVHELQQTALRAAQGTVRAADADTARAVVAGIRQELRPAAATRVVHERVAEVADVAYIPDVRPRGHRRLGLLVGAAALLLILALVAVFMSGRETALEQGIAAFRDDRAGLAEQHFRAALRQERGSITARLYLARILRAQGRLPEAADVLRAAAASAPRDPAVRRELGYLFLDLDRPQPAAEQFELAVELEPDEALNWVGVVDALARAGDPAAAEWLSRAPAAAQELIRTSTPSGKEPP